MTELKIVLVPGLEGGSVDSWVAGQGVFSPSGLAEHRAEEAQTTDSGRATFYWAGQAVPARSPRVCIPCHLPSHTQHCLVRTF